MSRRKRSYLQLGQRVHVRHEIQHLADVLPHALHGRCPALKHKDTAGCALWVTAHGLRFCPDCRDCLALISRCLLMSSFSFWISDSLHYSQHSLWLSVCPQLGRKLTKGLQWRAKKQRRPAGGRVSPLGDLNGFCLIVCKLVGIHRFSLCKAISISLCDMNHLKCHPKV